jgi:hypothetical protein
MENLVGQKFNRLTPIECVGRTKRGVPKWRCLCDCGNKTIVTSGHLKNGHSKSCGCFKKELTVQRNKASAGLNKNCWTKEEMEFLKINYPSHGTKFCSDNLNRTKRAINSAASILDLKTVIASQGVPQKNIIKKISNSKVLSLCQIHGETIHYCRKNKIIYCFKCHRKNPIANFASRIRGSIRSAFNRISRQNGEKRKTGAMRHLDYTSKELYDYLTNIQKLQNNQCPICQTDYKKCILSIEHVIPLANAKTEQEIIDLFCLQNLNLMCKNCNSSKQDKDYNTWMKSKSI